MTYLVRRRGFGVEDSFAVDADNEDAAVQKVREGFGTEGSGYGFHARMLGDREVLILDRPTYAGDLFYKGTR
jgi:hypothetical protein